ncbi:MAG TPA: hypothetical protein ENN96_00275 [Candidatus Acetothermia bacterium]|nr:hypothetical protein [Candidatus Acetothermia bacterium]
MNTLDQDYGSGVFDTCEPPCLSLYQPTHRRFPENQQDPIRFGNLVRRLEQSLLQRVPKGEAEQLLAPFRDIEQDRAFWNNTLDGLAVLSSSDLFRTYLLQRPVSEQAVVADSFHIKPLMRIQQSADRYHVLALSRRAVKLYEGNRDVLDEIEPAPGIPRTLDQALGIEEQETVSDHAVTFYGDVGGKSSPVRRGSDGRQAATYIDTERFFRAVDRGILEQHSRPSGLPLILVALPEHQHMLRELSHNPHLVRQGVETNPDALSSVDDLRQRVWQVMEPYYLERLTRLAEAFGEARSKGIGDDGLEYVAKAAAAGRVATLLVEADRMIPGRINTETGDVEYGDLAHPEFDDLLDDVSSLALRAGGEVVIVPAERMPTETGIAAIYRY